MSDEEEGGEEVVLPLPPIALHRDVVAAGLLEMAGSQLIAVGEFYNAMAYAWTLQANKTLEDSLFHDDVARDIEQIAHPEPTDG